MSIRDLKQFLTTSGYLDEFELKCGGNLALWVRFNELTAAFIAAQQPTRVIATGGAPVAAQTAEVRSAKAPITWGGNKWGGMRGPHLHYAGEIYILNDKQWQDFSAQVLGKLKEKLNGAQKVTFNQLMEVSDAVEAL